MRFDIWLSLLLAAGVAFGLGKAAEAAVRSSCVSYQEEHRVPAGEVGGAAGAEVPRAECVEDLLRCETFTVESPGIEYRNRGGGYHGGACFNALTLPSGELVAARINSGAVQVAGTGLYSGVSTLPVGRVVWEDLTEDESFLEQIQYAEPLSRTDFYVDMVGGASMLAEEQYMDTPVLVVQLLSVLVCFPIFHALGARLGLFPCFFPPRRKKTEEPWA